MACGLWLSQLLERHPLLSLLCITAGTSPFLNLSAWKRALPWLCAGWGVGLVMGHVTADHQRGAQRSNRTEWLLMRPSFLPCMSMANGDRIRGIWHGVDVHGQHVKVWMEVSHIPKPCPQWTLVQLSPIRPSGFGMVHWSSRCSQTAADNVARNLDLEGPAWACPLGSDIQNESQKKWIQPPFEVWIHRDQSSETSHPVLLGDVSSVSTGS